MRESKAARIGRHGVTLATPEVAPTAGQAMFWDAVARQFAWPTGLSHDFINNRFAFGPSTPGGYFHIEKASNSGDPIRLVSVPGILTGTNEGAYYKEYNGTGAADSYLPYIATKARGSGAADRNGITWLSEPGVDASDSSAFLFRSALNGLALSTAAVWRIRNLNTEVHTILASGNHGFGTITPAARSHIETSSTSSIPHQYITDPSVAFGGAGSAYWKVYDGTGAASSFLPTLATKCARTGADSCGLTVLGEPGEDLSTSAAFLFSGRLNGSDLVNSSLFEIRNRSTMRWRVGPTGDMTLTKNIILPTSVGTMLGTAANQLLSFWGAPPVVQRPVIAAVGSVAAGGEVVDEELRTWAATVVTFLSAVRSLFISTGLTATS